MTADPQETPDPTYDPAQAEWDRTSALDEGADPADLDPATATGDDPGQLRSDDEEIPATDMHPPSDIMPDSQGRDPGVAEVGEEGQGDLAPEDY